MTSKPRPVIRRRGNSDTLRSLAQLLTQDEPLSDAEYAGIAITLLTIADRLEKEPTS